MRISLSLCLLFLTCSWTATMVLAVGEDCSDGTVACPNRYCSIGDNNQEECGSCLEDFVEYESVCINLADINLDDFLQDYEPIYRDTIKNIDRLTLLLAAARFISEHNADRNATFRLGLTRYSADSQPEMKQRAGYFYVNVTGTSDEFEPLSLSPTVASDSPATKVDWVSEGAVTSVKDQGRCGCCWAVSLAGAVEGAAFVNNGYFQSLSFQQYISCNERNLGCDGGNLVIALGYTWLNTYGGLTRLNDYEYTDYDGSTTEECQVEGKTLAVEVKEPRIVLDFGGIMSFQKRLETMKQALDQQPVSMVIRSSCKTLSNYRNGILTDDGDCACSDPSCIDHAILMVGYDDTSDPPYFKLKNSWGKSWGEDGYFRIAQTEKGLYGLFGLLAHGVIPNIATNVTAQVTDDEQDVPLKPWAWVLIILACIAGCMCCVGVVKKMHDGKGEGNQE